jgi:hypothetical protein
LWHTYHVNKALDVTDKVTADAYRGVRDALIQAVRSIHPDHESVADDLDRIGPFIARFNTVFSLNYDLLIYWAMLRENERRGPWLKDAFVNGTFDTEWERLTRPYPPAKGATLVFYPHGNLALATRFDRGEFKIQRTGSWETLLERIIEAWEAEASIPLFVSEGTRAQKEKAVMRSSYLGTIYHDVLTEVAPSVAIYGWGMGRQDTHILRQFRRARVERFAVSVYTKRNAVEVQEECERIERRLKQWVPGCDVTFYDSGSAGCWNNP